MRYSVKDRLRQLDSHCVHCFHRLQVAYELYAEDTMLCLNALV